MVKGILQDFNGLTIFLYRSEDEREEVWNGLTPIGREKYGWKKVKVKIEDEA